MPSATRASNMPLQVGERNHRAKLREAQVRGLIARYARGQGTYRTLALDLGVHLQTVAAILQGRRWPHLPRPSRIARIRRERAHHD